MNDSTDFQAINPIQQNESNVVKCFVALGSNMGDSVAYIRQAIADLKSHSDMNNVSVSRYYKSKPHGPKDQPDYLNTVVSLETHLSAVSLLDALQNIENDNDRVREGVIRWGARTLDLDLLFYADEKINTKRLIVPHPRICERAFVLFPLRDLLDSSDNQSTLKLNQTTSILDCINSLSADEINNTRLIEDTKDLANE